MTEPKLEDVFKINGTPTYTFVEPQEYPELLLNLRTPGRGLVIEGPSGIGKTTAVETALEKLGLAGRITKLSARRPQDVEYIEILPTLTNAGTIIVDDFHKLKRSVMSALADHMKTLADSEERGTKLVILGINRAGENLIQFAHDLVNRIDVVRFERNPDFKVNELIEKGEKALKIKFNTQDDIVRTAQGSFYLAQMLCREMCLQWGVTEALETVRESELSFEGIRAKVWERLGMSFRERCARFCRGTKLRREGRAPYLHILYWLAQGEDWTLDLRDAIRRHSELRVSITQVVDKGYLKGLINSDAEIRSVLHFDENSNQITVEDPQFLFYIRNISWRKFAQDVGFLSVDFNRRYDFALSFAGSDRDVAEALFNKLVENEVEVFYDKNEQHRILAEDVEEYLRPIYQSEARFVIVLLGPDYPKRIWTKIESDAFKQRFSEGAIIPIWFSNAPPSMFDESRSKGGLEFDRSSDFSSQINQMSETILKKLADSRRAN